MTMQRTTRRAARCLPLLADPCVAAVHIRENGEPLVDLLSRGILCADMSRGPRASRMARAGLADRLRIAERALPPGLHLHVFEAFRTAAAQGAIIDAYADSLRQASPHLDATELARLSSRFVAPLDVAPHVAGAAVDITIVDEARQPLDMGTPIDATPEQSEGACYFDADNISPAARANRSLLAAALAPAGLVNYPTEWWHWSFGDRFWAYATGARRAMYGAVVAHGSPLRAAIERVRAGTP
jgi:D-alanyl-D-alanine dipeptidase